MDGMPAGPTACIVAAIPKRSPGSRLTGAPVSAAMLRRCKAQQLLTARTCARVELSRPQAHYIKRPDLIGISRSLGSSNRRASMPQFDRGYSLLQGMPQSTRTMCPELLQLRDEWHPRVVAVGLSHLLVCKLLAVLLGRRGLFRCVLFCCVASVVDRRICVHLPLHHMTGPIRRLKFAACTAVDHDDKPA